MSWAVVTDSGDVEITEGSPLASRIESVESALPGWRITRLRWVVAAGRKSWIAYIKSANRFIAPDAMGSPAAAINEAVRCAKRAQGETDAG